jgi:hypothetical protein
MVEKENASTYAARRRVDRDGAVQCLSACSGGTGQVPDPIAGPAQLVPDLGVVGKPAVSQLEDVEHPLPPTLGLGVEERSVGDRGEDGVGRDHQALPGRQAVVELAGPEGVGPHQRVDPGALVEPGFEDPVEGEGERGVEARGALEISLRRIWSAPGTARPAGMT